WAFADNRKLRGSRERASHERTEGEDKRRFRRDRIERGSSFVEQKLYAKTAAPDELPQSFFSKRDAGGSSRGDINSEKRTVITKGHSFYPPASADRIRTWSSLPRTVRGSLTN